MPLRNWNDGQELTFEDFNASSRALTRELYDRLAYEMLQRKTDAFFDDSFLVEFATTTSFTVRPGLGFQYDASQSSPEPVRRPIYNGASFATSISTPDGSNDRIDLVVVKSTVADELTEARKFKNATTLVVTTENLVTQKDWSRELVVVAGTPAASPVAPAVPAGYIQIASILVEAVVGITVAGNITDSRVLLPLAGTKLFNTTGFVRLTSGGEVAMDTLLADVEAFLVAGLQTYTDMEQKTQGEITTIGNPAASRHRVYNKEGKFYSKNSAGVETPLDAIVGGASLDWRQVPGASPFVADEFDNQVLLFEQGASDAMTALVKVPQGFISGRQILAYIPCYSLDATDEWKMQITTTLIRRNDDAVDSVVNQEVLDSGDITNTVAKQYRQLIIGLTTIIGSVNSIVVLPGDTLKLKLERIAPAGSEVATDIRFLSNATEVTFS